MPYISCISYIMCTGSSVNMQLLDIQLQRQEEKVCPLGDHANSICVEKMAFLLRGTISLDIASLTVESVQG